MQERTLRVMMAHGLHLRVAAEIVRVAKAFDATITLRRGGILADAKSVIHVLMLGGARDTDIGVQAQGADERAAVDALDAVFRFQACQEHGLEFSAAADIIALHADTVHPAP